MLTPDFHLQLNYSGPQSVMHMSRARHRVAVAGRRGGKTTFALGELCLDSLKNPGGLGWYIGPTHDHAKDLAWEPLLELLLPTGLIRSVKVGDLKIQLRNGYTMRIRGAEAFGRLRGKGLNFAVLDEYADMDPKVWTQAIRPALSDKKGRALFIGSPDGYDHFYDLWLKAKLRQGKFAEQWEAFQYTTLQGGFVEADEIEAAREDLSTRDFRQEYEASFESIAGRIYHAFHRIQNVSAGAIDSGGRVFIGMDFNVNPMTATFSVRPKIELPRLCHTFGELVIPNSNTLEMAEQIRNKFGAQRDLVVYPDPSGGGRETNAPVGQTDFTILKSKGFRVYLPPEGRYMRKDKYNTVNGMLCNSNKERNLYLNPSCTNLIKGFDGLCYKEGTNIADETGGHTHVTDAEAYMINGVFPMASKKPKSKEMIL